MLVREKVPFGFKGVMKINKQFLFPLNFLLNSLKNGVSLLRWRFGLKFLLAINVVQGKKKTQTLCKKKLCLTLYIEWAMLFVLDFKRNSWPSLNLNWQKNLRIQVLDFGYIFVPKSLSAV